MPLFPWPSTRRRIRTMPDDSPRRQCWFQIHLSTLIMLVLVAGLLAAANLVPLHVEQKGFRKMYHYALRGWPWCCHEIVTVVAEGPDFVRTKTPSWRQSKFSEEGTWGNVAVVVVVLLVAGLLCEGTASLRRDRIERSLPGRRRWFKVHCLTLGVFILVGAILATMNVKVSYLGRLERLGWPMSVFCLGPPDHTFIPVRTRTIGPLGFEDEQNRPPKWDFSVSLPIDICINGILIVGMSLGFEALLRRRSRRLQQSHGKADAN